MPYTTVLFDVGDTLLRVPEPAPSYQRLLAALGCPLPLKDVERIVTESRRQVREQLPLTVGEDLVLDREVAARRRTLHVETVVRLAGVPDPVAAAEAFFALYVGTDLFTLFPDVVETLEHLCAAGYRLGIVSNWEPRLPELCAAHGIDHYFSFTVVSEIEGYVKPHPHLYRRALELAGAAPEEVLHVGDRLREDIEGAAAVGIRAVLLDRAGTGNGYQPRIRALSELVPVLEQMEAAPLTWREEHAEAPAPGPSTAWRRELKPPSAWGDNPSIPIQGTNDARTSAVYSRGSDGAAPAAPDDPLRSP